MGASDARDDPTRAREVLGDVNRGRFSSSFARKRLLPARVPTWQLHVSRESAKLLGARRASGAGFCSEKHGGHDVVVLQVRGLWVREHTIQGLQSARIRCAAAPLPSFWPAPTFVFLSTGIDHFGEEEDTLLPGQVRDPKASLWRADCDPAYLQPVDEAGVPVEQKPKVRHAPLRPLSSRAQRSRAPRPPPSTPSSPSTYVHAGVRNHSGRLRVGPWPRPRRRQPRHCFEAGRASRRLRPHCRRRSHRECGRRASRRPPITGGDAARRPARLRH